MKKASRCPNCDTPQSRWEITEPYPFYPNRCATCGASFVIGALGQSIGSILGVAIVIIIVVAYADVISWTSASATIVLMSILFVALSPFFCGLKAISDDGKLGPKRRFRSFIGWQSYLLFLLVFIMGMNIFLSVMFPRGDNMICCNRAELSEIDDPERLRELALFQVRRTEVEHDLRSITNDTNAALAGCAALLVILNIFFYFKLKVYFRLEEKFPNGEVRRRTEADTRE